MTSCQLPIRPHPALLLTRPFRQSLRLMEFFIDTAAVAEIKAEAAEYRAEAHALRSELDATRNELRHQNYEPEVAVADAPQRPRWNETSFFRRFAAPQ